MQYKEKIKLICKRNKQDQHESNTKNKDNTKRVALKEQSYFRKTKYKTLNFQLQQQIIKTKLLLPNATDWFIANERKFNRKIILSLKKE